MVLIRVLAALAIACICYMLYFCVQETIKENKTRRNLIVFEARTNPEMFEITTSEKPSTGEKWLLIRNKINGNSKFIKER